MDRATLALLITLVFPLGDPTQLAAVCTGWFASTPEAPSSPHKCFPHRVTDFKPATKWLKACHHNASYLGARILCWILLRTCLSIVSAFLHFQQICVRANFKRRQKVQSHPGEARSKFSFTFLIRKFYYVCFFSIQVFP